MPTYDAALTSGSWYFGRVNDFRHKRPIVLPQYLLKSTSTVRITQDSPRYLASMRPAVANGRRRCVEV